MALNFKRGFFRLWVICSCAWAAMWVVLMWDSVKKYISAPPPTPLPEGLVRFDEAMNPILSAALLAASFPVASFILGLFVIWIFKGFKSAQA